MPISRDEFLKQAPIQQVSDEELLKKMTLGQAYTTKELKNLIGMGQAGTLNRLHKLAKAGTVEMKKSGIEIYWMAKSLTPPPPAPRKAKEKGDEKAPPAQQPGQKAKEF